MKRKYITLLALILAATLLFASCASGTAAATGGDAPQTVVVAIGNSTYPIGYIDEDGNPAGFDYEVLVAANELLPQYEFVFVNTEMKNILVGLETGSYDIGAHIFTWTEERAEKYLVGEQPYGSHNYMLTVLAGNDSIASFRDLEGKTVITDTGSAESYYVELYNELYAAEPINLVYGEVTADAVIKGLQEGRYDCKILQERSFQNYEAAYPGVSVRVGERDVIPGYYYHYFSQGNEQLRDDLNEAIQTLKDNGRLREINEEIYGNDFTAYEPVEDPGAWEPK